MVPSSSLLLSVKAQTWCSQWTSKSAWGGSFDGVGGAVGSAGWDLVSAAPSLSVTTRRALECPAAAEPCDGFRSLEVVPSPKFHDQLARVPSLSVLRSTKVQRRSWQVTSNSACGGSLGSGAGAVGFAGCERVSAAPSSSVTRSVTPYWPAEA